MDGDWIELQEYAGRHVGLAGVARPFFSVAQLVSAADLSQESR
jgi:hypothetical protein